MAKALISDIDGTLIRHGDVDRGTLNTLHDYHTHGLVILNSGRAFDEIKAIEEEFHLKGLYDFTITCNGSYICTHNHKVLYNQTIPRDVVDELIMLFSQYKSIVSSEGKVYYFDSLSQWDEAVDKNAVNKIAIPFEEYHVAKHLAEVTETLDIRLELNRHCADFIPSQCHKGQGAHFLLEHLGLNEDEALVVGDDYNDIAMLHDFPNSFTFSDSPKEVQLEAHHIIDHYQELQNF